MAGGRRLRIADRLAGRFGKQPAAAAADWPHNSPMQTDARPPKPKPVAVGALLFMVGAALFLGSVAAVWPAAAGILAGAGLMAAGWAEIKTRAR